MKHSLNFALGRAAVFVLLWISSLSGVAAEPDKISLAYCTDCVPFHFQDKDGRPAGMIIDFWRLWSERTGIEIDFRTAPWDGTLRMVADGRADAHAGLFFSDARAKFLEYGTTLTKTDTHFFVKKGLPPIETVAELAGHRVGVLAGDFVEEFLKKSLPAQDVIGFENYDGIMTALRDGKLQIFAADTPTGIFHLQNAGLGFDYAFPADRPLYRNDWLVAARKGDTELIRVINAGMALVTAPERQEIEQRWVALGTKGFTLTTQDIVALVAFLGIAFTVGVLIWNRTLRRRIELRTGELETQLGQRRLAEEEVRKVWDAIEELSEGFALYDSDDRLVKCNQRYREIFSSIAYMMVPGTSFEDILDAAVAENFFPNEEHLEAWKRARIEEHHQPSDEGLLQRSNDGRWILVKEHRTTDGGYLGIRTDVTELKRAEQELAESQERMQVALSSMSDGIYILDGDLKFVAFNQRYVDLLNFPEGLVREGGSIVDVIEFAAKRGDYGSQFDGDIDDIVAGRLKQFRSNEEFLSENITPAGRIVEYRGSPIKGGGFVAIIHDMTERKRAAEALSDQLKFTEALVDTIPNPIFVKGPEGRYLNFNRAYERVFGIRREDYIGKSVMALEHIPLDLRKRLDREDEELFRTGGAMHAETIRELSDGKQHEMLYWQAAFELSSGVIGGLVGVLVDISEQKRAEEALSDQLKFTEALVDTIPNLIFVKGPEGRYLNFNRAYEKAFGSRREDDIGKTVMELEYVPLDIRKRLDQETHELLRTGGTTHAETVRELSDGKEHDLLYWQSAFELSSGVIGGLVGVFVDISEQKSMERDLAAARDAAESSRLALEEAYEVIKSRSDRMEDELNIAREIQMSMVPLIFPPFPIHDEFSIFAMLEPAREIGGDFYDFYFIDEDHLCLCIGDVSGKGVPAALFMAVAKTLIKSRAGDDHSTASVLTHVNDELSADNKSHMFVTIFVAILNIGTGEMVYTNAGHNPPYLKRADGTLIRLDRRHGPVVAAVEGMVYEEDHDRMAPGDLLMLYTDGVTEARGPEDGLFSEDRLRDLLASMNASGVEQAVAETVEAVRAFEQETEQTDDITLLALEFHGSSHDSPLAERRIVIENRLPNIAVVNETFDAFAEEFGIPKLVANKFNMAFDDLLNNVITFAYRDDSEHEIEINIERAKNRLTATITDDGVPFNPLGADIPDTTLSLSDRDTGGLGILLVRSLVDELSYQRRIGRNVVTITSHLDAEGGESPNSGLISRREPPEPIE